MCNRKYPQMTTLDVSTELILQLFGCIQHPKSKNENSTDRYLNIFFPLCYTVPQKKTLHKAKATRLKLSVSKVNSIL